MELSYFAIKLWNSFSLTETLVKIEKLLYLCSRNAIFVAFFTYNWVCWALFFVMQLQTKNHVNIVDKREVDSKTSEKKVP